MGRVNSKAVFFFILLFSITFAAADDAGGYGGAFLQPGVSARVLGMGGTFVGLSDDPSSIVWNPGGMAQLKHNHLEFMRAQMSLDRTYNFLAVCRGVGKYGTAGFGWINYSVGDIPSYDEEGNYLGNFSDSENAFLIGYSYGIKNRVLFGGNLKLYKTSLAGYGSSGKGFDFGTLVKAHEKYLSFGFAAQDLVASAKWDTPSGREDPYPTIYRVGVKTETPYQPVNLLFDIEKHEKMDPKYRFGAEYWYPVGSLVTLGARGGINHGDYSLGGSFKFLIVSSRFGFDYGYSKDPIGAGNTHRFSLGIEFPVKRLVVPPPIPDEEIKPPPREEIPKEEGPEEEVPVEPVEEYVSEKLYIVKPGDDLVRISARPDIYKDPYKWRLIYEANRDKISNPYWIYPGQELIIPREE